MTKAEEAYKQAQEKIATAIKTNAATLDLLIVGLETIPPEITNLANTLTELNLYKTHVTDLTPLKNLSALSRLSFPYTKVTDLAPLKNLTTLSTLHLNNTQVKDLAPLKDLTALSVLYLSGTQVTDLAPLNNLTALRKLSLYNTQVTDPSPILQIDTLERIWITDTPFAAQTPELADINKISDLDERGKETLRFLREDWVPPEKTSAPELPQEIEETPIIRFTAPTEFTTHGKMLDLRHTPKRSEARHASSTPIDEAQCEKTRKALDALVRTLCSALRKYKREDEKNSNRVRAAEQLLVTTEDLAKSLKEPTQDFLPTLMQDYIETLALGFNESVLAFEANDIALYRRVI